MSLKPPFFKELWMPISLSARNASDDVNKIPTSSQVTRPTVVTTVQRLICHVALKALQIFVAFYRKVKDLILCVKSTKNEENESPKNPLLHRVSSKREKESSGKSEILTVDKSSTVSKLKGLAPSSFIGDGAESSEIKSSIGSEKSSSSDLTIESPRAYESSTSPVQLKGPAGDPQSDQVASSSSAPVTQPIASEEVQKAQLSRDIQNAFANFFPKMWKSVETIGALEDATRQLEIDLPRQRVSICDTPVTNFDQFTQLLGNTPFGKNQKQISELLSQAGIGVTTTTIHAQIQEHLSHIANASEGALMFGNQHGSLKIDLHPSYDHPNTWIVEGKINLHLSLVHELFESDEGYHDIADCLLLHFSAELPIDLVDQSIWNVHFSHSAVTLNE